MGSVGGVLMSSGRSWGGHGVGFGAAGEPSGTSGRHFYSSQRMPERSVGVGLDAPGKKLKAFRKRFILLYF